MIIGKRSSIVFNGTTGEYVDGVWQESVSAVTVSDCSVQPFSQKDYSQSIRGDVPQKRIKVYCPVTSGLSVAEGNTFVWSRNGRLNPSPNTVIYWIISRL